MSTQPEVDEAFAQLMAMTGDELKAALAWLAGYEPALFVKVMEVTVARRNSPRASLTSGR